MTKRDSTPSPLPLAASTGCVQFLPNSLRPLNPPGMTPAEFKRKWARFQGKESAAHQSHFDHLCRLLAVLTPLEADPSGEVFCFQKRVVKDAELFDLKAPDANEPSERGGATVWKQGCLAREFKGSKKKQLLEKSLASNLERAAKVEHPDASRARSAKVIV